MKKVWVYTTGGGHPVRTERGNWPQLGGGVAALRGRTGKVENFQPEEVETGGEGGQFMRKNTFRRA